MYILTNLLSTTIHGDKEKEKKNKNSEITNLESLHGEKKKKVMGSKKRRGQLRHTTWKKKNERYSISWSKEQKSAAKCCNATITKSAQY